MAAGALRDYLLEKGDTVDEGLEIRDHRARQPARGIRGPNLGNHFGLCS